MYIDFLKKKGIKIVIKIVIEECEVREIDKFVKNVINVLERYGKYG